MVIELITGHLGIRIGIWRMFQVMPTKLGFYLMSLQGSREKESGKLPEKICIDLLN